MDGVLEVIMNRLSAAMCFVMEKYFGFVNCYVVGNVILEANMGPM